MAYITQRPGGWCAQIRRKGAPSIARTFDLKADAEAWAREVDRDLQRVGIVALDRQAQRVVVSEILDRYESDRLPQLRGQAGAAARLRRIRARFGQHFVGNVRGLDVAAWRDDLRRAGLSAGTVIRYMGALSAVFSYAERDLSIPLPAGNPCRAARRPPAPRSRDRRLRPGEFEALRAERPDLLAFVVLAVETSMRRGELAGLLWNRVDLSRRTAHLVDTKNGESRTVALSSVAISMLATLPRRIDGRVFPWVTADGFSCAWKRHVKQARKAHVLGRLRAALEEEGLDADAEIRAVVYKKRRPSPRAVALLEKIDKADQFLVGLRFHDLRHEATSRLFEKGLGIMEVASMTGHKSLAMLKRYTHIDAERLAGKLG